MRAKNSPLLKLALVLVCLNHVACFIANGNHSVPEDGREPFAGKTYAQSESDIISAVAAAATKRGAFRPPNLRATVFR
jgi:hypothetical protein